MSILPGSDPCPNGKRKSKKLEMKPKHCESRPLNVMLKLKREKNRAAALESRGFIARLLNKQPGSTGGVLVTPASTMALSFPKRKQINSLSGLPSKVET